MYAVHLDPLEKVRKTTALGMVQAGLEAKLTSLKLEGKHNKQLEEMTKVLEDSVMYLHELFEYAEQESKEVRKLSLELELSSKREKELQKQIDILK